ncbi:hypothetical protein N0V83_004612 [Neocucurbitaria cava]|uniref:SH3 domain-containing protein n=1 Tax=Neocucurbitaria cava TaxID=798079 RepID=A0A9W8YCA8_9PLEO|nr:hypothetical protein N0V83_004612 [Neocucurbitaria cava]
MEYAYEIRHIWRDTPRHSASLIAKRIRAILLEIPFPNGVLLFYMLDFLAYCLARSDDTIPCITGNYCRCFLGNRENILEHNEKEQILTFLLLQVRYLLRFSPSAVDAEEVVPLPKNSNSSDANERTEHTNDGNAIELASSNLKYQATPVSVSPNRTKRTRQEAIGHSYPDSSLPEKEGSATNWSRVMDQWLSTGVTPLQISDNDQFVREYVKYAALAVQYPDVTKQNLTRYFSDSSKEGQERIRALGSTFDSYPKFGKKNIWNGYSITNACTTLHRYLNSLAEPVVPVHVAGQLQYLGDRSVSGPARSEDKSLVGLVTSCAETLKMLPKPNFDTLVYLLSFFTCVEHIFTATPTFDELSIRFRKIIPPLQSSNQTNISPVIVRFMMSHAPNIIRAICPTAKQKGVRFQSISPAEHWYVTAAYNFDAWEEGDLSFKAGDEIRVSKWTNTSNTWWKGDLRGKQGRFPANYVTLPADLPADVSKPQGSGLSKPTQERNLQKTTTTPSPPIPARYGRSLPAKLQLRRTTIPEHTMSKLRQSIRKLFD